MVKLSRTSAASGPWGNSEPSIREAAEPACRQAGSGSGWRLIAGLAVLLCLLVNVMVAWSAREPSFPFDEISTFQMSRMLAGEPTPFVRGAGYFPGWAFLLAPIWWLTDNPLVFYRTAVVLGIVVSLVSIWPLSRLGRRWGLADAQTVAAAAIVLAMPARAIQADYLLSERLLTLFVVLAALAAYRLVEEPSWHRAPELGLWLGLGLFTHARLVPVLLAAGIWLLMFALRHLRVGVLALTILSAAGVVSWRAGAWLNERLLGREFDQDAPLEAVLSQLTPDLLAITVLGQSWYQLVATFGLAAIGLLALVALVVGELRHWRIGGATFIFGALAAAFFASTLRWADRTWLFGTDWVRLDVWVYGRYNDSVFIILTLLAIAAVIGVLGNRDYLIALAGSVVLCIPVILWLAPRAPTWGSVTPAHIPGILPFWPVLPERAWPRTELVAASLTGPNSFWLIASLFVLVLLVLGWLLRCRPMVLATGLLVLVCVASLGADPRSNRFQAMEHSDLTAIAGLRELQSAVGPFEVAFDSGCSRGGPRTAISQNFLGFLVLPTVITARDFSDVDTVETVMISCADFERADELGLRRLRGGPLWGSAIWLPPGALQDEAEERELLE